MKMLALSTAAMSLLLGSSATAVAQYRPGYPAGPYGGYPGSTPTVSPYLNILGRGNPAINYYGITRPQIEFRNALFGSGAQGAYAGVSEGEDLLDPSLRRGTGHPAVFNNLSHFYGSNPAMGGVSGSGRITGGVGGAGTTGYTPGLGTGGRGRYAPPVGTFGVPRY